MNDITFYDVLTSPFVSFVLVPIAIALAFIAFDKKNLKKKK